MKTQFLIIGLIYLISLTIFGCNDNTPVEPTLYNNQMSIEIIKTTIDSLPTESLNDSEIAGLLFMREEEKLARDVYITFYQKYGLRVFNNISYSEETHTEAVKLLIQKYNLTDPVVNDIIGTFVNQDLQNLYNQLIERGNISDIEALKVGAAIEEIDILDLIDQINNNVDNQDIIFVYNNLKKGSENHLRAFVRNLSARGVAYSPVYLDMETYNQIIGN